MDKASGTEAAGNRQTNQYNDFANLRWLGARVGVKTGDLIQFKDVVAGASRASQNAHSVRFGLGDWTGADWVRVLWPTGEQAVRTDVEGNQRLFIQSP